MAAEELKTIVIFANTIGFKSIVFNSLNSSNIRNLNDIAFLYPTFPPPPIMGGKKLRGA